ncbi:transposase [Streptomyces shenzhenensis]|uniref:transposase n=1 Tax=Streptomyces shenzhenensis TaxID=943815 RepID=UPI00287BB393|nr:transposase [Streptomyces shenzhenensis]
MRSSWLRRFVPRTRASSCADEAFPDELGRSGRTASVRPVGRDGLGGAVRIVTEIGKAAAEVARDLGVQPSTLQNWAHRARARADAEAAGGLSESERDELRRLSEDAHGAQQLDLPLKGPESV